MSEAHIAVRFGKLQARVARLEAFVREYTRCPCCDEQRRCSPDCEYEIDSPDQYDVMMAAREALYGKEVEDGE